MLHTKCRGYQPAGSGEEGFRRVFSSPEPKAHGELEVYRSIRRPSVRPSVSLSVRP